MRGTSKQPHNAGQTVIVQQISPMPIRDMDWGPITITENWGRLFIRWNGQEVIAVMRHYPKLAEAIQHFIEPTISTPDPAQIRADALREALGNAATTIKNLLEVMATPDQQQCCDGRMCGCMGSTVYQEAEYYALQDVAAIAALLATPLSPTAVDGSPAPDAGSKEGV